MVADAARLEESIRHLAAIPRPSASEGERVAAEWLAAELRAAGCRDAGIEEERAHGTYWWPLGLLAGIGALGGGAALRGGRVRRLLGAALGGTAAAGLAGELGGGSLWFRRACLPHHSTWNVVAEAGDPDARETLIVLAHHDAAREGLIYHPAIPRLVGRLVPTAIAERQKTSPPLLLLVFGGPALVGLGALLGDRRAVQAGTVLCAGTVLAMADLAARDTVPGANDNLSAVAALLEVARALEERPVDGLRVLLVSCGAEESLQEGMQGFARRHFPALPTRHTRVFCLETVGSRDLVCPESEGMLLRRGYDAEFKDLTSECARQAGVELTRGYRLSFASDALVALRAGYRSVMIGSLNEYRAPANYHWRTDTPENVDYGSVVGAVRLCDTVIRRLARQAAPAPA
jgi:hypothetical protein